MKYKITPPYSFRMWGEFKPMPLHGTRLDNWVQVDADGTCHGRWSRRMERGGREVIYDANDIIEETTYIDINMVPIGGIQRHVECMTFRVHPPEKDCTAVSYQKKFIEVVEDGT